MAVTDTKFIKSLVVLGLMIAFVLTIVFGELSAVVTTGWDVRLIALFALIPIIMGVVVILRLFDMV